MGWVGLGILGVGLTLEEVSFGFGFWRGEYDLLIFVSYPPQSSQ